MGKHLEYYLSLLRRDFSEFCAGKPDGYNLSQGMLYFILYIGKHPKCPAKEISSAFKQDAAYTARSLARLEKNGFITREKNRKDRRISELSLTDQGAQVFSFSHELLTQWERRILGNVDEREKSELFRILEQITPNLYGTEEHV